jgi:hypothetical protein
MRLYTKLVLMVLVFAGIQHFAPPSAWGGEAWFTIRCHAAHVLGDKKLAADLVDEYYRENRRIDEVRHNIEIEIEIEFHLASAG